MKLLIVDTYYPPFLKEFVAKHPELIKRDYRERHAALMKAHFAEADSYSHYLGDLGHSAVEVVINAGFLQRQWAREHGVSARSEYQTLVEQVKSERPDVLYMQNMSYLEDHQLNLLREHVRLIVGQIASPLPSDQDLSGFDLIISSFPHFVRFFRNTGISSEYLPLAFDPRVLSSPELTGVSATVPVAFVGGLSRAHSDGVKLLERVAEELPLTVWGYGAEILSPESPLRHVHRGHAWGLDMYRALASARLAINRHIDVSGPFANNLRLYETTGVGTCLVTDNRENLAELFEPDREIVTYSHAEECVEKCRYLLEHEEERAAIALAGQRRTLSEHSYGHRMPALVDILERHLRDADHDGRRTARQFSPRARSLILKPHVREFLKRLPGQFLLREVYHRLPRVAASDQQVSRGYQILEASGVTQSLAQGWQSPEIAPKQRQLVDLQLRQMYEDTIAPVFRVAGEAVDATGVTAQDSLIEVGCASGYYSEVLPHLLRRKINYTGLDYSRPLVQLGKHYYPEIPFVVGDATQLPFSKASFDVVFSGTVQLHVADYAAVIQESARVARNWCIFHRTPVFRNGQTTYLSKFAYGTQVVELVFGERQLLELFESSGLTVDKTIVIETYAIKGIRGKVAMTTYVCRKLEC